MLIVGCKNAPKKRAKFIRLIREKRGVMKAKDKRRVMGWLIGMAAGLQAVADCVLLHVPNNITPIIMIMVYVVVGQLAIRALSKWAELTRKQRPKHRKVTMYTIGPERAPEPEMFLREVSR